MEFRWSKEQEEFRAEVRSFLAARWADPSRSVRYQPGYLPAPDLERALGERGWLGLTWPREYGGGARSPLDNLVLAEELATVSAPGVETLGHTTVGPSLLRFGSEEQKQRYVRGLCTGETSFCLGYSEPGSGSDLASLQCRASLDGDHYLVSGRKVWVSGAHVATHCWLAARTDPDESTKHRGISVLIVPMNSPGVTVRPLRNVTGDADFNEIIFEGVEVPRQNLVGEEGGGWAVLTAALATERMGLYPAWTHHRLLFAAGHELRDAGSSLQHTQRARLAGLYCDLWAARLLAYRVAYLDSTGALTVAVAAQLKLMNSELSQRIAGFASGVLGLNAVAWRPGAGGLGELAAHAYQSLIQASIGGGTSEVQRTLIAVRGLGLPRD